MTLLPNPRLGLVGLILLALASTVSADTTHGALIVWGPLVTGLDHTPVIEDWNPKGSGLTEVSPLVIRVNITNIDVDQLSYLEVNLTQGNTAVYSARNTTAGTGNGWRSVTLNPANGFYNMTIYAINVEGNSDIEEVTGVGLYSWYFNIDTFDTNALDTYGDCTTVKGYFYNGICAGTGLMEHYDRLNLTQMSSYLKDVNASNIWVEGKASYQSSSDQYTVLVDCIGGGLYTVWLGGFDQNISRGFETYSIGSTTKALNINNFTLANYAYWANIITEENGSLYNFNKVNQAELKIVCNNYAPNTLELKTNNINPSFWITKERPEFQMKTVNGTVTQIRKQQMTADNETVYLVQKQNHISPAQTIWSFTLEDFTGDYRKSGLLQIRANINSTIKTIHSEYWSYSTLTPIHLYNGTNYQVQVIVPGKKTINYGWITPTADGSKTLVATDPVLDDTVDHFEGLWYEFVQTNEPPYVIGFNYNFTTNSTINWVAFRVYNSSNQIVHIANVTTPAGTLLYTITDATQRYKAKFEYDIDDHSYWWTEKIFNPVLRFLEDARERLDLSGNYNNGMSGFNILGISGAKVETFISWMLMGFVALLGTVANVGIVSIILMMLSFLLYAIGYIGQELFYSLILFTGAIAILTKMASDRGKR